MSTAPRPPQPSPAEKPGESAVAQNRGEVAERPTPPELETGYYARNFERVLDTVTTRYGDLLTDEEAAYAEVFGSLSERSKRLYVRLILRRGPCFRRDLLSYEEIDDLARAARELRAAGFLDLGEEAPLEDGLAVLRRPELIELVVSLGELPAAAARRLKRGELLELLLRAERQEEVRRRLWTEYDIWRPLHAELLLLFRLLFFGNLGQDFSEFVISDLGIVRYESYPLSREHRLFQDRTEIDQAFELRLIRQQVYGLLEERKLEDALALARAVSEQADTLRPVARRQADGILIRVARELERQGEHRQAVELYTQARRPPARERRCRALEQLGELEQALSLCREMAASPLDETESGFVPLFEHRMKKKLGLTQKPWKRSRRPTLDMEIERPQGSIEMATLEALAARGRRGIFSENWLWRSLFGLAFWDVVFEPVPGVFHHPFQTGPWDLSRPEFRIRRQARIEQRLSRLREEPDLRPRLWPVYQAKVGIANALVPWHPEFETPLNFALERVSGPTLAVFCDRLSSHLRRYRRGLPDLLVESDESPVGFELLEVKGPGDQLRPEQGAWIDFLNRHNIPTRILKVRWL